MNKKGKFVTFILIILIALIAWAIYSHKNKQIELEPVVTPVVETISSIKGCYVAKLGQDIYTLNIASQNSAAVSGMLAYNNYQKDSSSGEFSGTFDGSILLGMYSFDSEGMHSERQVAFKKSGDTFIQGFGPVTVKDGKEVFTDLTKLTYDPKSTFVATKDCLVNFIDSGKTVSFDHNALFKAWGGDKAPTLEWQNGSKYKGLVLANASISRAYMPQTNFSGVKFTIGRSADANAIKSCTLGTVKGDAVIDGHPFKKFISVDAGAGNFYDTTSYRGVVDGDCYSVEYTIHSTSIGNYPKEQNIKEFDTPKIQGDMEHIIKSLKFLVSSN